MADQAVDLGEIAYVCLENTWEILPYQHKLWWTITAKEFYETCCAHYRCPIGGTFGTGEHLYDTLQSTFKESFPFSGYKNDSHQHWVLLSDDIKDGFIKAANKLCSMAKKDVYEASKKVSNV